VADAILSPAFLAACAASGLLLIVDVWKRGKKSDNRKSKAVAVNAAAHAVGQNQSGSGVQIAGDVHGNISVGRSDPVRRQEENRKYFVRLLVVTTEPDTFSVVYDKDSPRRKRYVADCAVFLFVTNLADTPRRSLKNAL
jgi:hypothetical protein